MNLRMKTAVAAAVFTLGLAAPAFAAPMFPDVPENHWARDAVATLAAKGIVEGYPDGTFKGDRNATRWEVAMMIARLLGQMEQEHATFATKAELAELQKLVDALRSELDALGARVGVLEDKVDKLDLRVSELERITFYGSLEARLTAQSFTLDNGASQSNNNPDKWAPTYDNAYQSYNDAVGSIAGMSMNPRFGGVLPVADYRNGVGLTNGTGFTMKGILGMRIRVSDDIDAGAEFAAYTSAGNSVVDALWGVSAPYLCNQFGGSSSANSMNNAPYTRMVLDNFWVIHNPSGIKLTLGAYSEDNMDNILFAGQKNLSAFGPEYLDRFGFNLSGRHAFEAGVLRWELLGSRISTFADNRNTATQYDTDILGVDVAFEFGGGQVKLNFMRAANESANGNEYAVGLIGDANMAYGMESPIVNAARSLQWVNPSGYYAGNAIETNGPATTADNRPVVMAPGVDAGFSYLGPQSMTGYGISANYKWDIGESGNEIYAAGEYAHTEYKANKDSSYTRDGDAFRIEVGANLLEGDLDLSLAYVSVDPTYDPFINMNPVVNGVAGLGLNDNTRYNSWNIPNINYYSDMWSLHDTEVYPHNREGIRFNGQWRFSDRHGLVWAKASFLNQKKSSLYDVRTLADADGAGIPQNNILGFAPGFMDPVFYGYADPAVYGAQSATSFDANLNALEDHKGKQTQFGIGASYKWDNPRLKLDAGYEHNQFKRNSDLAAIDGGSQNYVKLNTDNIHIGLGWEANDMWTLRAGCDMVNMNGHWDPSGVYNQYAIGYADSIDFKTIDVQQTIPFIGFDCDLSANTQWNMDFRYYDTKDKVDAATFANYGAGADPYADQAAGNTTSGYTAHPFSWYGWQVTTQFKVKF